MQSSNSHVRQRFTEPGALHVLGQLPSLPRPVLRPRVLSPATSWDILRRLMPRVLRARPAGLSASIARFELVPAHCGEPLGRTDDRAGSSPDHVCYNSPVERLSQPRKRTTRRQRSAGCLIEHPGPRGGNDLGTGGSPLDPARIERDSKPHCLRGFRQSEITGEGRHDPPVDVTCNPYAFRTHDQHVILAADASRPRPRRARRFAAPSPGGFHAHLTHRPRRFGQSSRGTHRCHVNRPNPPVGGHRQASHGNSPRYRRWPLRNSFSPSAPQSCRCACQRYRPERRTK